MEGARSPARLVPNAQTSNLEDRGENRLAQPARPAIARLPSTP